MKHAITPILDRILVRNIEKPKGKIIWIKSKAEREVDGEPYHGEIIAVGPKVKEVKAGDKALFEYWTGLDCEHNGEKMLMMKEQDIMAVFT